MHDLLPISKSDLAELCDKTGFLPNTIAKALSSPETTRKSTRTLVIAAREAQLAARQPQTKGPMP